MPKHVDGLESYFTNYTTLKKISHIIPPDVTIWRHNYLHEVAVSEVVAGLSWYPPCEGEGLSWLFPQPCTFVYNICTACPVFYSLK